MKIFQSLLLIQFVVFSQSVYNFGNPNPNINQDMCDVDINSDLVPNNREEIKKSVFRLTASGNYCSATFVNNEASNGQPSNLFITAWHCFKSDGENCQGSDFDFDQNVELSFNFQTPPNRHHQVFIENNNHTSKINYTCKIKLIEKLTCAYGDFALCEILGPPMPPHFNVYYAGWDPSFINPATGDYINFSHPAGSLKKAAKPMGVFQHNKGQYMLSNTEGELTEFQIVHDGLLYKEANIGIKNGFLSFNKVIIEPNKLMIFQVIGDESKTTQILQARNQLFSSVYLFRH